MVNKCDIKNFFAPKVMVNRKAGENGILSVIYKDRVENWKFSSSESKEQIDKQDNTDWRPWKEEETLKNSGFKHIHYCVPDKE